MLLALNEEEPRRQHLIRYQHWWNDPDHAGSLDELWPDATYDHGHIRAPEGTIDWPDGGESMRPQQLLNAMREGTRLKQLGPNVLYSYLDSLRDSGLLKVIRS